MTPAMLFGGSPAMPAEADAIVAAEVRAMTVPVWEPACAWGWRVVFARRDGTALLVYEAVFGPLEALVFPTTALAVLGDHQPGYGAIPYEAGPRWLDGLLDRFQLWDGGDLLGELTAWLPGR